MSLLTQTGEGGRSWGTGGWGWGETYFLRFCCCCCDWIHFCGRRCVFGKRFQVAASAAPCGGHAIVSMSAPPTSPPPPPPHPQLDHWAFGCFVKTANHLCFKPAEFSVSSPLSPGPAHSESLNLFDNSYGVHPEPLPLCFLCKTIKTPDTFWMVWLSKPNNNMAAGRFVFAFYGQRELTQYSVVGITP